MERKLFLALIALSWVSLPLTALHYARVWNQLPARVAVHFDANWQPNGWTSREGVRMLALGTTTFLLITFTIAGYTAARKPASRSSKWAMLVVFYVVLVLTYRVNSWIVERNLSAKNSSAASLVVSRYCAA
ncbi:MAG: DUF1648 domain-containing protein [Candidatus Sulfotelmatobacter sp.]